MRLPRDERERNYLCRAIVYPIGDRLNREELEGFGLGSFGNNDINRFDSQLQVGAFTTTLEYRPIRPGEWYFSGAEVMAYRAPNGTTDPYHVARLVSYRIRREVKLEQVRTLTED